MSIDSFYTDLLPNIGDLSDRFITGDDDDLQLEFDNNLQIRADMAVDFRQASNRGQKVANQIAYDTASAVERQMRVIGLKRIDYFQGAVVQRQQTTKVYQDIRNQGTVLRNSTPTTDTTFDDVDEPFLDDDGVIVFDSNE